MCCTFSSDPTISYCRCDEIEEIVTFIECHAQPEIDRLRALTPEEGLTFTDLEDLETLEGQLKSSVIELSEMREVARDYWMDLAERIADDRAYQAEVRASEMQF